MLRKILITLSIVGFFVGLALFMYPYVSSWVIENNFNKSVIEFEKARNELDESHSEKLYDEFHDYNVMTDKAHQGKIRDAWTSEQDNQIIDLLQYQSDVLGTIEIPKMKIKLPIYLGASDEHMAKGIANLDQTSIPIGGISTNCVLVGHRGYRGAPFFRDIEELELGDLVIINNLWEQLEYKVSEIAIIYPHESDKVAIREGEDMVTLVTCHPYRHNYQRYVVYCKRSDQVNVNDDKLINYQPINSSQDEIEFEKKLPVISVIITIFVVFIILLFRRKLHK